ncbi:hypothetical protein FVE85_1304 [Porphyridium purpureum]|uniref:Uncharacterized protein n=1 Tax=Porphyridium purpureum TaxID=35688 RepID=A0A5J4YK38_PORPP|nr:hypothetical protein FVE85_1304 [Porphyridium purpureum]|eukprot:POR5500..scf251_18
MEQHPANQKVSMQGSPNLRNAARGSPALVPVRIHAAAAPVAASVPAPAGHMSRMDSIYSSAGMTSRSFPSKSSSLSQDRRRKPRNKLMQSKGTTKERSAPLDARSAPGAIDEYDPNFDSSEEALLDEYVVHYDEDVMMRMDD